MRTVMQTSSAALCRQRGPCKLLVNPHTAQVGGATAARTRGVERCAVQCSSVGKALARVPQQWKGSWSVRTHGNHAAAGHVGRWQPYRSLGIAIAGGSHACMGGGTWRPTDGCVFTRCSLPCARAAVDDCTAPRLRVVVAGAEHFPSTHPTNPPLLQFRRSSCSRDLCCTWDGDALAMCHGGAMVGPAAAPPVAATIRSTAGRLYAAHFRHGTRVGNRGSGLCGLCSSGSTLVSSRPHTSGDSARAVSSAPAGTAGTTTNASAYSSS